MKSEYMIGKKPFGSKGESLGVVDVKKCEEFVSSLRLYGVDASLKGEIDFDADHTIYKITCPEKNAQYVGSQIKVFLLSNNVPDKHIKKIEMAYNGHKNYGL